MLTLDVSILESDEFINQIQPKADQSLSWVESIQHSIMWFLMQYRLSLALILALIGGCADANSESSAVKKVLKPLINNQCSQELYQSKLWNVSTYLMTAQNKQQFRKDVCECVAEHALTDIPTKDLIRATIDDDVKNQVTQKAVLNSAKACILQMKQ